MTTSTIILAIAEGSAISDFLPPEYSYDFEGKKKIISIHRDPQVTLGDVGELCNFDYMISENTNRARTILIGMCPPEKLLQVNYESKLEQYIKLSRVQDYFIVPKVYTNTINSIYSDRPGCNKLVNLTKADKCIVNVGTHNHGFSNTVFLAPTYLVPVLNKYIHEKNVEEILRELPDVKVSSSDKLTATASHIHGSLAVEYISDIKLEYSLMVSGGTTLVSLKYDRDNQPRFVGADKLERNKSLGNSLGPRHIRSYDESPKELAKYGSLGDCFSKSEITEIYELVELLELPYGSIDLFRNSKGKLGVLGYSPKVEKYLVEDDTYKRHYLFSVFTMLHNRDVISEPELEYLFNKLIAR